MKPIYFVDHTDRKPNSWPVNRLNIQFVGVVGVFVLLFVFLLNYAVSQSHLFIIHINYRMRVNYDSLNTLPFNRILNFLESRFVELLDSALCLMESLILRAGDKNRLVTNSHLSFTQKCRISLAEIMIFLPNNWITN